MSRELVRALRVAYDDIDGSETGQPSRTAISTIPAALSGRPEVAKVVTLWSAARALILPQLTAAAVDACARAITAVRQRVVAGASDIPSEVGALLQPTAVPRGGAEEAQLEAQVCVGHALAYSVAPEPARFMKVVDALVAAQRSEFFRRARAKSAWIGWMDDVVSRGDRFTVGEILELLERTLRGTLLIPALEMEAVGDESGDLEVWTVDPASGQIATPLLRTKGLEIVGRALTVTVLEGAQVVVDPLRIEYLVEHFIHRRYLGDMYAGRYDEIAYRCLATGETWTAPA